jgi:hypothetical protein
VVLGLLVAGDLAVRSVAEAQLADRVKASAPPEDATIAGATNARISSFPFVGRLLTSGEVSRIRVSAADVTVDGLTFARVAVDLRGVKFDRDRLLSDHKVVLASLTRGTATVDVTQQQLSERLGFEVTLLAGKAEVKVSGQTFAVRASVDDNTLQLAAAGLSVSALRVPTLPLVPCVTRAEILPGRIRMSCTLDQVPPGLVGRSLAEVTP